MFVGFSAYAQWFQVRSSAPSTALRLFSYQQVDFGESGVSADNGTQLEGAQFTKSYRVLNLYLLSFSKKTSNWNILNQTCWLVNWIGTVNWGLVVTIYPANCTARVGGIPPIPLEKALSSYEEVIASPVTVVT